MVDIRLVFMLLIITKVKIKETNLVGKSLETNVIWSIKGGAGL